MNQKDSQNNSLLRQNIDLIENERRELAFELHDEIGQNLTAIRTAAQLMIRQSEGRQTHPVAETIVGITDQMFDIMHRMLHRLHPSALDKLGFEEALEDLVSFVKESMQLDCELKVAGDLVNLKKDMQLALYRIIQESLTNAVRHGQAKKAFVNLDVTSEHIMLSVANDGEPLADSFDTLLQSKSSGIGLQGIKHRAQAWKGIVSLENKGDRVVLICSMPLVA